MTFPALLHGSQVPEGHHCCVSSHAWCSSWLSEPLFPQPDCAGAAQCCVGSGTKLLLICFCQATLVVASQQRSLLFLQQLLNLLISITHSLSNALAVREERRANVRSQQEPATPESSRFQGHSEAFGQILIYFEER